ncbi:MAG: porin family protein [Hydrogenophilaceae bacterium]|jgi:opacity protein-like surface antigen|nr:porin family protein [Hydrogenophilaceae bacterium]
MTLRTFLIVTCAAAAMFAHGARAQEAERYARVSAGLTNLRDAELEYPDVSERDRFASFDNGFAVAGAVGRALGPTFRIEGEIAYRNNDEAFITPGGGGEGQASSVAFMANGYWAPRAGAGRVSPYFGLGIGAAQVTHEGFVDRAFDGTITPIADDSGWGFAWQGMAGARVRLSADWAMDVEYRYFSVAEPKIEDADGFIYDTDYDSHALMIGAVRRF